MEPTCFEDYGFYLIKKLVGDLPEPLWVKVSGGDAGAEFQLNLNSPVMISGIRGLAGAGAADLHPEMFCTEMTKPRDDENCVRYCVREDNGDGDNPIFYMAYADIQEAYLQRLSELNLPVPDFLEADNDYYEA